MSGDGIGGAVKALAKATEHTRENDDARESLRRLVCRTAAKDAARDYPLLTPAESDRHGIIDPVYQCVAIVMHDYPHGDRAEVQRVIEGRYAAIRTAKVESPETGRGRRFGRRPVAGSSDGFGLGGE